MRDTPTVSGPGYQGSDKPASLPVIQGYKIIRQVGEGGMGIVYLAEQTEHIRRQVALKVVKPGMDSRQVITRFEAERQVLALLDHPNIAHVYNAGTTEKGRPYFVMEYINGVPITDYCDQQRLSIEERLEIFKQACEGIQHAHQRGIIHRDIKPSNILVLTQEDKAIPKVIDFGVAKAISQELTEQTMFTALGQLIGTPEYMSPEQTDLTGYNIDIRTDVYSLGVVLYQLLTGVLPFDPKTLRQAAFAEIQRIIKEVDPPRPSTKLSSLGDEAQEIAGARKTVLRTLARRLHKELEWIPLKAMRKERDYRYQSVSEFAGDIQNYLTGSPLIAIPESRVYRIKKYVRRNRVLVSSAAVIVFVLIIGVIVSTFFAVKAEKQRLVAEQNRSASEEARQEAVKQEKVAINAEKYAKQQQEIAEKKSEAHRRELYINYIAVADRYLREGALSSMRNSLQLCPEDLRNWEWYYLWKVATSKGAQVNQEFSGQVTLGPANSPWENDKLYLGTLKILTGHKFDVSYVSFDKSGKNLFSYGNEEFRVWDIDNAKQVKQIELPVSKVRNLSVSPNGDKIAIVSNEGIIILDHDGNVLKKIKQKNMQIYDMSALCWSPNERYIAFELSDGGNRLIKIWDIHNSKFIPLNLIDESEKTKKQIREEITGREYDVLDLIFSPNSKYLASATNYSFKSNMTVRIWNINNLEKVEVFEFGEEVPNCLAFSPDGKYLAVGFNDPDRNILTTAGNSIRILDFEKKEILHILKGHLGSINKLSYNHDGTRIVSSSGDGTIKIWDTFTYKEVLSIGSPDLFSGWNTIRAIFSPDGRRLAVWGGSSFRGGNEIKVFETSTDKDVEDWIEDQNKKVQGKKQAAAKSLDLKEQFKKAVSDGDLEKLRSLAEEDETLISYSFNDIKNLTLAAQAGHDDIIRFFVSKETKQSDLNYALHASINNCQFKAVKTLVSLGADVNFKLNNSYAWSDAVKKCNLDIVKFLINSGADINGKNHTGYTPLHLAALEGKKDIAEFLIEHGAALDEVEHIDTALTMALEKGHYDIAKLLINAGAEVNVYFARALHLASNHKEIKDLLIKNGAVERDILSRFQRAIQDRNIEEVDSMLQTHPQLINWIHSPGQTPIFFSIKKNNAKMVSFLISKGAKVNIFDSSGQTPLHCAVDKGCYDIVEVLIQNNADINVHTTGLLRGYSECTPLHLAVRKKDKKMVLLLILQGADVNATDEYGRRPSYYSNSDEVTKLLEEHGGYKVTTLLDAVKDQDLDKVKVILEQNPELANAETRTTGYSVLHHAIAINNIELVKLFIEENVDLNHKIKDGKCPLELAMENRINIEIPKMLIANGADVNIKPKYQYQYGILYTAINKKDPDLVNMILKSGADVNVNFSSLGTPLYCSIKNRTPQISKLLIKAGACNSDNTQIECLKVALDNYDYETIELLLENCTDVTDEKVKKLFSKFYNGSGMNCTDIIVAFVTHGMKVNEIKDEQGRSLLHNAISYNNIELVKWLLTKGADVNSRDEQGYSPLHDAMTGNVEIVKLLIENGAEVNSKDNSGNTPMHRIKYSNHDEKLNLLLKAGADINKKNDIGITPLQVAVFMPKDNYLNSILKNGGTSYNELLDSIIKEDVKNAKALVSENPEIVRSITGHGNTPLHYAVEIGNLEIVEYLLDSGAEVDIKNNHLNTPLHLAASRGLIQISKLLIAKGADINAQNKDGRTPLHHSIGKNRELLKFLLDSGADVNIKTYKIYSERTPLHVAINSSIEEKLETIKLLLDYKADVNIQDSHGNTVLHSMISAGYDDKSLEIILENNASLVLKNEMDYNPMQTAIWHSMVSAMKLLKRVGATVNDPVVDAVIRDDATSLNSFLEKDARIVNSTYLEKSLLNMIIWFESKNILNTLIEKGLSLECDQICTVAKSGNLSILEKILDFNIDLNCQTITGDTPLHYAAGYDQKNTFKLLMNKGADFTIKNNKNQTCMHMACKIGSLDIVKILFEANADINPKDENGNTPLHYGALNGHKQIVRYLLENGAEEKSINKTGQTPLDVAFYYKHEDIAELFHK